MKIIRITVSPKQYIVENIGSILLFWTIIILPYLQLHIPKEYFLMWSVVHIGMSICFLFQLVIAWFRLKIQRWLIMEDCIYQYDGFVQLRMDEIEMYRIIDYQERQSLLQRLFGVKTLLLITMDHLNREIVIRGIDSKSLLLGEIRKRVEKSKMEHRIYEITNH